MRGFRNDLTIESTVVDAGSQHAGCGGDEAGDLKEMGWNGNEPCGVRAGEVVVELGLHIYIVCIWLGLGASRFEHRRFVLYISSQLHRHWNHQRA
jgi:hypothetical protein